MTNTTDAPLRPGTRMTHMKGMPYQFLFFARHSETQEECAVYECLYENPRGALWIRPRGMFEENARRPDGTLGPRFARDVDAKGAPVLALGVAKAQARTLGARLNGRTWRELEEAPARALESAFASLALWREAGDALAVARGHWLVARAALVGGHLDLARAHVEAYDAALAAAPDAKDFDRVYALEARARLASLRGDADAGELRRAAWAAAAALADAEDRALVEGDLATGPW